MAKIAPYCTPAMLSALTELSYRERTEVPKPLYWPLRSRGWIDKSGNITRAGVDYLAARKVH